jgi:hypothetical protein
MPANHLTEHTDTFFKSPAITAKLVNGSELLNLNEILSERAALYEQLCGPSIALTMRLANNLDPVVGRPIDVDRLLLNLVLSARSSMLFGGRLELATSNVSGEIGPQECSVRLQLQILRNSPENEPPADQPAYWDPKLARCLMQSVVSAHGGMLTACQHSELVSTTEILLPSSRDRE